MKLSHNSLSPAFSVGEQFTHQLSWIHETVNSTSSWLILARLNLSNIRYEIHCSEKILKLQKIQIFTHVKYVRICKHTIISPLQFQTACRMSAMYITVSRNLWTKLTNWKMGFYRLMKMEMLYIIVVTMFRRFVDKDHI